MIVGFTYNGKHSIRDMHIVHRAHTRPVAQHKEVIENLNCVDGSYDYSDYLGRYYYNDKVLEMDISIKASNPVELNREVSKIVKWLNCGYSELIFDDMPNTVWDAKVSNIGAITEELQRCGKSTIQYRCKPFNRSVFSSSGILLDDSIALDTDVPIGLGGDCSRSLANGINTMTINNYGDVPTAPIIRVRGSITSLSITDGTHTLAYTTPISSSYDLVIDCVNMICMYNNADTTSMSSGDFVELAPGENTLTITVAGTGTITVTFPYRYFYGANFEG